MTWTKENGDNICSDCNWELQETTPRFSRRHYQAFVQVLNVIIDNLDTVHTTKVRQQAGEETIVFMLDTMIDYFSHDNPNFNEKIFRSQIPSP
jgi:hypothetical protein